jgi:hypothetical protein
MLIAVPFFNIVHPLFKHCITIRTAQLFEHAIRLVENQSTTIAPIFAGRGLLYHR